MTIAEKARKNFNERLGSATSELDHLEQLQVALAAWKQTQLKHLENGQTLGVGEEVGELAYGVLQLAWAAGRIDHAILKAGQGIRGYDEDRAREEIADALADIMIFAISLATEQRLNFSTLVNETAIKVMKRRWADNPETGV